MMIAHLVLSRPTQRTTMYTGMMPAPNSIVIRKEYGQNVAASELLIRERVGERREYGQRQDGATGE